MTKVVPWVPYIWPKFQHIVGPHVTKWDFDQAWSATSYAHVAVN